MVIGQFMIGVAWLAGISPDRAMQLTNDKSSAEYVKTFLYYCAAFLNCFLELFLELYCAAFLNFTMARSILTRITSSGTSNLKPRRPICGTRTSKRK